MARSKKNQTAEPTEATTTAPVAAEPKLTLAHAQRRWIDEHLLGRMTEASLKSYALDLGIANEFFGPDCPLDDITAREIERFNSSQAVNFKPNGKPKAEPTILKTQRVLRMCLTYVGAYPSDAPNCTRKRRVAVEPSEPDVPPCVAAAIEPEPAPATEPQAEALEPAAERAPRPTRKGAKGKRRQALVHVASEQHAAEEVTL